MTDDMNGWMPALYQNALDRYLPSKWRIT